MFEWKLQLDIREFFMNEKGSVSITEAICLTHRQVWHVFSPHQDWVGDLGGIQENCLEWYFFEAGKWQQGSKWQKCFVNFKVSFCFRVDIADNSKKKLLNGFIESVKSLELAADASREEKDKEFRKIKLFFCLSFMKNVRDSQLDYETVTLF